MYWKEYINGSLKLLLKTKITTGILAGFCLFLKKPNEFFLILLSSCFAPGSGIRV